MPESSGVQSEPGTAVVAVVRFVEETWHRHGEFKGRPARNQGM
jgi:hypothetical protein